jgi:hypothetical protein
MKNVQSFVNAPESIENLAVGYGYSMVSCKITSGESLVGYMYREQPGEDEDSGWRFMSGTETDEYLEDESNVKLVDVNIVANLDKAIIPFLKRKPGCELERDSETNSFVDL